MSVSRVIFTRKGRVRCGVTAALDLPARAERSVCQQRSGKIFHMIGAPPGVARRAHACTGSTNFFSGQRPFAACLCRCRSACRSTPRARTDRYKLCSAVVLVDESPDVVFGCAVQICEIAFGRPRLSHVLLHLLSFFCAVRFFRSLFSSLFKRSSREDFAFPPTHPSINNIQEPLLRLLSFVDPQTRGTNWGHARYAFPQGAQIRT
jgi:hypothetical protein